MAKKIKKTTIDRATAIERLVEDVTAWDLGVLLGFTKEARKNDLRHMTNKELFSEMVSADLVGAQDSVEVVGEETDPTAALDEKITEAAKQHGEDSEPDMEVGDLQEALYAAWKELDPAARQRVFDSLELWNSEG